MATARTFRLATLVLLVMGAALLPAEPAEALSCIQVDPRHSLAKAEAAFIGEVVSTRSLSRPEYQFGRREILTFRVHEVVKGNLGELVEVYNTFPDYGPNPGQQLGVLLYAVEGGFETGACGGFISSRHLRIAQRGGPIVKNARDGRAEMSFRLRGRRLTVRVSPYPPRRVRRALRRPIKLACGNHIARFDSFPVASGPEFPRATATARFRRGARKLTVLLNRDVSLSATSCGIRQGRRHVAVAAFRFP